MNARSRVADLAETSASHPEARGEDPIAARVLALQRCAGNAAVARWAESLHDDSGSDGVAGELRRDMPGRYGLRTPVTAELMGVLLPVSENPAIGAGGRYAPRAGAAFVRGGDDPERVDPDDVDQGALGDCWLMAALAAIARANPALIESMVRSNGDGTYDVTLHTDAGGRLLVGAGNARTIRVDSRFGADAGGNPLYAGTGDISPVEGPELWVMLIEKAYAITAGVGDMDALRGGGGAQALLGLTGIGNTVHHPSQRTEAEVLGDLDNALATQRAVTASTLATFPPQHAAAARERGVFANHVYAISGVDPAAGTIDLQNPHGSGHLVRFPVALFLVLFDTYEFSAESLAGMTAPRPPVGPGPGPLL